MTSLSSCLREVTLIPVLHYLLNKLFTTHRCILALQVKVQNAPKALGQYFGQVKSRLVNLSSPVAKIGSFSTFCRIDNA